MQILVETQEDSRVSFFNQKRDKQTNNEENARAPPLSRQHDAVGYVLFHSNISVRAVNSGTRIPTEIEIIIAFVFSFNQKYFSNEQSSHSSFFESCSFTRIAYFFPASFVSRYVFTL